VSCGGVVEDPKCLYVASLRLSAVLAAVGRSRGFIRRTLCEWGLQALLDSVELVVSELVTNAVKTTATIACPPSVHHVIGVQLRMVGASLYVEVWDPGEGTPVIREQTLEAEGGRGLFLVEAVSERWDICRPAVGGKIVWAELSVPAIRGQVVDPRTAGFGAEWERVETALRQRVLA
jgi:anti-sigma regulatory factor (Ser/Thr protein kinase)